MGESSDGDRHVGRMKRPLHVMLSLAFKPAFEELAPAFEQATGEKVDGRWVPTAHMLDRVKGGEIVDALVFAVPALEELIAARCLDPMSRVDVATCGVGVAVRPGATRPDLSSGEALKRYLLAAESVVYSKGPSGVYLSELLRKMGIADDIAPKVRQVQGEPVGAILARGEGQIGFQQICELLPIDGIDYVGPLPPDVQEITLFAGAVHVRAQAPQTAKALLDFLKTPGARHVISAKGLEPV